MTSYSALSYYYDELNSDCPYGEYADFIDGVLGGPCTVLDCGCGTGNISLALAKKGYRLTAFDISDDALSVAENKARECTEQICFLRADMRGFTVGGGYDAVISTFDSVNYLLYDRELCGFFASANACLKKGGVLIFDVNTAYRYENIYADNCYVLESKRAFLSWQNYYNGTSKRCKFYLSLFTEDKNGLWERSDEEHTQKYHDIKKLTSLASSEGFEVVGIYGDTDSSALSKTSEKAYFVLRKL